MLFLYLFGSGIPAYPRNGTAQFQLLNAFRHLRSCTIFHFEGSNDDLQFATYILQNAKLLEVMEINFFIQNYQVIEELSSCPRMSPGCKLSF